MSLFKLIKNLSAVNTLSKHEQLVQGIIQAINTGVLRVGDQLPSINQMVGELGFARKTIVKAYEALKYRGLVESKKMKGYFIISQDTNVTIKVALLLFSFQRFQEEFYNAFRTELGSRFQIDVFFHHYNTAIFETVLHNIKGKYGMYVIAPIPKPGIRPLLLSIVPEKLVIIDRYLKMPDSYSHITQEFEQGTYLKLIELLPQIRKYTKLVLFFSKVKDYPEGVLRAFSRFIVDYEIVSEVCDAYLKGSVQKGVAYFTVNDSDLWVLLQDCQDKSFKLGDEVGVLSQDDHIVKEIISGGITTTSCDFKDMARRAAAYVKNPMPTKEFMPIYLFKRNSI